MFKICCLVCKKKFEAPSSKRKYCSKECYYKMKKIRKDCPKWTNEMKLKLSKKYKGKGNPMYGKSSWNKGKKRPEISGEKHPNWKGGYWLDKDNRKYYQSVYTNGKAKAESRKVVEEHIKRELLSSEIIHHINGDVTDNNIENLMVCTRADHIKMHMIKLIESRRKNK